MKKLVILIIAITMIASIICAKEIKPTLTTQEVAQMLTGITYVTDMDSVNKAKIINFAKSHILELKKILKNDTSLKGWTERRIFEYKGHEKSKENFLAVKKYEASRDSAFIGFYKIIPTGSREIEVGYFAVNVEKLKSEGKNVNWNMISPENYEKFKRSHPITDLYKNWGDQSGEVVEILNKLLK